MMETKTSEVLSPDTKTSSQRVRDILNEMCLMNDLLMSVVLEHKECMELVLRIILNKNDLVVKKCKSQYTVTNLRGASQRLTFLPLTERAGCTMWRYSAVIQRI